MDVKLPISLTAQNGQTCYLMRPEEVVMVAPGVEQGRPALVLFFSAMPPMGVADTTANRIALGLPVVEAASVGLGRPGSN